MSNERRRSSTATEFLEVVVRPKKYYKVKHPQDHSDRGKIVVSAGEKWRILKNVAVISLAMMTQYVAYQGTLNLQSSLNAKDGLGTIALSGIYLSMGISCLVLPTIMIRLVTCKWTLVIGMICFIPYIALQLYSRFLTLIPAGILLGVAAAPMWAAHATYLTQISQIYAIITESEMDAVITLFFGIFFFAWQNADTIGNLLSSLELVTVGVEPSRRHRGTVPRKFIALAVYKAQELVLKGLCLWWDMPLVGVPEKDMLGLVQLPRAV